jgi:CRISPR system Cascade subunit CasA
MISATNLDLCLRWLDKLDTEHSGSLFALFAALARGEVTSLPALRPHQREPWHAFAVQVAAMALIAAGFTSMPENEEGWRSLLLVLTPDWPDGEAWSLVVQDWSRPALLQPPVVQAANRADYRSMIVTPDALDMLVTSRNHDVKAERMQRAADEDWFFALLTLQTTEGYLGAGNFGISRMNGGFASRMVLGLRSQNGMAACWHRDVSRLLEDARARPDRRAGLTLLWLPTWDGTVQLGFGALDELYVDACRRIRLGRTVDGEIEAQAAGSKVARVAAAALKGITGDPWAPLKADGSASVTPTASGFGYRQITRLLQNKDTVRPLLAEPSAGDPPDGMALVAAALVRGQGKTEGLHRRTIPFSRTVRAKLRPAVFLDRAGEVAGGRMEDAGEAGRRLRYALFALYQGGPDKVRRDDDASGGKAAPWLTTFDRDVDRVFFDDVFWKDVARKVEAPRRSWRIRLRTMASDVFEDAAAAAPRTAERRIRARAVARNILDGSLRRFVEDTADGA